MIRKIAALMLLPAIMALHLILAGFFLSLIHVPEKTASRLFEDYFNGKLSVQAVKVNIFSGLRFEGVSIVPAASTDQLFSAKSINVGFAGASLLWGSPKIRTVHLEEPVFVLDEQRDGAFSFENLPRPERRSDLCGMLEKGEERSSLRIFVTNALLQFVGNGPLAEQVDTVLAPGQRAVVRIPYCHWIDLGEVAESRRFSTTFIHDALGEFRAEGSLDEKGLRRLTVELDGAALSGQRFDACFSQEMIDLMEEIGFDGKVSARVEAWRNSAGELENSIFFSGFNLYLGFFPLQLDDLEGRGTYRIEEKKLELEQVTAVGLGQRVFGNGSLDLSDRLAAQFTVSGMDVPFCNDLERAIEETGCGEDYRAFAPMGRADFRFDGRVSIEDPIVKGQLRIWPQGDASASYEGYLDPVTGLEDAFPYRIHNLRGEILILGDRVELNGLEGYGRDPEAALAQSDGLDSGGRFSLNGSVAYAGEDFPSYVSICGRDLHVCDEMLNGLELYDPATAETVRMMRPTGRFDLSVDVDKPAGGTSSANVVVDLKDVTASYPGFSVPIHHLRGRVTQEADDRLMFKKLTGNLGASSSQDADPGDRSQDLSDFEEGSGTITVDGAMRDGRIESLIIEGRHQQITPTIKEALFLMLHEQASALLDIEYEGTLNFLLSLEEKFSAERFDLMLDFHLDRLFGGALPVVVEDLRGSLNVDLLNQTFQGHDLSLRAGGGRFALNRLVAAFKQDCVELELEGEGQHVAMNADLSKILPGGLLGPWEEMDCRGGVDLNRIALSLVFTNEGELDHLSSETKVRINNGSIEYPLEIDNIHGSLNLNLETSSDQEAAFLLKARSEGMIFELQNRLFTDVEAAFHVNDEALEFSRFQGIFYGGDIQGKGEIPLRIEFVPPRHFEGSLKVQDAELKRFFDRSDYAFRNIEGTVDGEVEFHGDLENPHHAVAVGKFSVREGALFELPIIGNLSRLMGSLTSSDPPTFTGAEASFTYRGGIIHLPEITLSSDYMELYGAGKANFDGLELRFIPATGIVPTIPVVGHLVNFIKDGLLTYKVSGPYSNLDVSYDFIVNRIFTDDSVPDAFRYKGRQPFVFAERF